MPSSCLYVSTSYGALDASLDSRSQPRHTRKQHISAMLTHALRRECMSLLLSIMLSIRLDRESIMLSSLR